MAKSRIFQYGSLQENVAIQLDKKASHHLSRVLRIKLDDEIILFNGEGGEYLARIVELTKKYVAAEPIRFIDCNRESPLKIHLGQCIAKGNRMDLVIQKATELGVTEITPLYSQYCDVKLNNERLENKLEHWRNIAVSACEQSERTQVPSVHSASALSDWIRDRNETLKFILHPHQASQQNPPYENKPKNIALLIGPEGGFSDCEIEQALQRGFYPLSLGPRILRAETAPLAAISLLQAKYGDFNFFQKT